MNIFHWTVKKSNENENLILKTSRDIFLKIQEKFTSKQTNDVGLSYEKATVHFHIFFGHLS